MVGQAEREGRGNRSCRCLQHIFGGYIHVVENGSSRKARPRCDGAKRTRVIHNRAEDEVAARGGGSHGAGHAIACHCCSSLPFRGGIEWGSRGDAAVLAYDDPAIVIRIAKIDGYCIGPRKDVGGIQDRESLAIALVVAACRKNIEISPRIRGADGWSCVISPTHHDNDQVSGQIARTKRLGNRRSGSIV